MVDAVRHCIMPSTQCVATTHKQGIPGWSGINLPIAMLATDLEAGAHLGLHSRHHQSSRTDTEFKLDACRSPVLRGMAVARSGCSHSTTWYRGAAVPLYLHCLHRWSPGGVGSCLSMVMAWPSTEHTTSRSPCWCTLSLSVHCDRCTLCAAGGHTSQYQPVHLARVGRTHTAHTVGLWDVQAYRSLHSSHQRLSLRTKSTFSMRPPGATP